MTKAVYFDLWNTLLYCPTKAKVDEIIRRLGLTGKIGYYEIIGEMEDSLFVNSSYDEERFFKELCSRNNVNCNSKTIADAAGIWRSRLQESAYFLETEAVLTDLRREFKVGLISNTDRGGAEYTKNKYLKGYFDTIIMSCEVGKVKPDPGIFEIALEELDAKPEDSWMVGDSPESDIQGALNVGLNAILVDRDRKHTTHEYPVIHNLNEIRGIIQ